MSPEYGMEGLFSMKSDVYSFGVLLLEIISGRRNTTYYCDSPSFNLVEYVSKRNLCSLFFLNIISLHELPILGKKKFRFGAYGEKAKPWT